MNWSDDKSVGDIILKYVSGGKWMAIAISAYFLCLRKCFLCLCFENLLSFFHAV